MYRKYGIPQRARDGGAVMCRKYGIPQRAWDGGAVVFKKSLFTAEKKLNCQCAARKIKKLCVTAPRWLKKPIISGLLNDN